MLFRSSVVLVLSQIFTQLFGFDFWLSVVMTAGVVVFFTVTGGMWAVLVTDTIQAAIIAIGSTIMIPIGIARIGGLAAFTSQLPATHSDVLSVGFSQTLGWFLIGVFIMLGYQTILQRGLAAKDDKTAKQAFFWGGLFALLWYAVPFVIGTVARVVFPTAVAGTAYYSMASLFGPFGNVFFLIVLLMSGMSTVSSTILTTTANISLDLYKRFIRPDVSNRNLVLFQRVCLMVIIAVCTVIGHSFPYVVELFWIGGRIMASGLAPVLTLMILWPKVRVSPFSTLFAMIGGAAACIITQTYQASAAVAAAETGAVILRWTLDPILTGLPVCFAILIIGTLIESRHSPETLRLRTVTQ